VRGAAVGHDGGDDGARGAGLWGSQFFLVTKVHLTAVPRHLSPRLLPFLGDPRPARASAGPARATPEDRSHSSTVFVRQRGGSIPVPIAVAGASRQSLVATGVVGAGFIFAAVMCTAIMWLMMRAMSGRRERVAGHRPQMR